MRNSALSTPDQGSAAKLVKQTLRRASRSMTGGRGTWHFMAWSFVISQSFSREADHAKIGHGVGAGDPDLKSDVAGDSAAFAANALGDVGFLVSDDDGYRDGAGGGLPLLKALDVHFEQGFFNAGIGAGPATGFGGQGGEGFIAAAYGNPFGDGSGGGGAVGSGTPYNIQTHTLHIGPAPGGDAPGGNHGGGPLGGGPIGGGPGGPIGGGPGAAPVPVPTAYDGPPIHFTEGIAPFAAKLGLGATVDSIASAALPNAQSPVHNALNFTANPFEPLGVPNSTTGLHHGDRVDVHYVIQASGYGAQGAAQIQATNEPGDPGSLTQTTSADTKMTSNMATLNDQVAAPGDALFVKGNYSEFNTIIQINITTNNDTVSVLRTSDGPANAPSLINTGDNQQHNSAHITDTVPGGSAVSASGTGASVSMAPVAAPVADAQPAHQPADAGPHSVVMGAISQHDTVVQMSQISAADALAFNFNDVITGTVAGAASPAFANVHAGGDVQTNVSDVSFAAPISQAGFTAKDFLTAHKNSHVSSVNGDYYKINTIFQLNVVQDSNHIAKVSGGPDTGGGAAGGSAHDGVLASGGNIALNEARIIHHDHSGDLFVAGKYTQYNLVLQINALADNSSIIQTSAVHHDGTHASDPLALSGGSHDAGTGSHNGTDGGNAQFSLPDPLHELALRGGQTADHMM